MCLHSSAPGHFWHVNVWGGTTGPPAPPWPGRLQRRRKSASPANAVFLCKAHKTELLQFDWVKSLRPYVGAKGEERLRYLGLKSKRVHQLQDDETDLAAILVANCSRAWKRSAKGAEPSFRTSVVASRIKSVHSLLWTPTWQVISQKKNLTLLLHKAFNLNLVINKHPVAALLQAEISIFLDRYLDAGAHHAGS